MTCGAGAEAGGPASAEGTLPCKVIAPALGRGAPGFPTRRAPRRPRSGAVCASRLWTGGLCPVALRLLGLRGAPGMTPVRRLADRIVRPDAEALPGLCGAGGGVGMPRPRCP